MSKGHDLCEIYNQNYINIYGPVMKRRGKSTSTLIKSWSGFDLKND